MPLPSPNAGEKADAFHSRCMDDETMKSEFPDLKQRNAVCYSQLRKARGQKAAAKKGKD